MRLLAPLVEQPRPLEVQVVADAQPNDDDVVPLLEPGPLAAYAGRVAHPVGDLLADRETPVQAGPLEHAVLAAVDRHPTGQGQDPAVGHRRRGRVLTPVDLPDLRVLHRPGHQLGVVDLCLHPDLDKVTGMPRNRQRHELMPVLGRHRGELCLPARRGEHVLQLDPM